MDKNSKKGFFSKVFDKLDNKIKEKADKQGCCCCGDNEQKNQGKENNNSCCK